MYSRRDFGKVVLAAVPVWTGLANITSRINGVRIGVQSYSFRDLSLDDAIQAMVAIGIGECELFSGHVEPFGRSRPDAATREQIRGWRLTVPLDHFSAIRQKFDDAGISLQAYYLSFNDSFSDQEIDRGFQMAEALGVKVITASATLSSVKRIAGYAEKYRITVGMHNHSNLADSNQFARPESFAQALATSPLIGVNLDIGHFTAAGYDPLAYIETHHDRITNLHLKDRKANQGPNVPWGEGDTRIREVLQLLKRKKYDIPANIEYEYPGADTVSEVRRCFQFCKDALA